MAQLTIDNVAVYALTGATELHLDDVAATALLPSALAVDDVTVTALVPGALFMDNVTATALISPTLALDSVTVYARIPAGLAVDNVSINALIPAALDMDNVSIYALPVMPLGVVNKISLSWSDDRGHTFGNPVLQDMGPMGNYLNSLQWQRLGYARDRVFKISWSTPVKTALQGAWVTFDMADDPLQAKQKEPA